MAEASTVKNYLYSEAFKTGLFDGSINFLYTGRSGGTENPKLKCILLKDTYVFDDAHINLADIEAHELDDAGTYYSAGGVEGNNVSLVQQDNTDILVKVDSFIFARDPGDDTTVITPYGYAIYNWDTPIFPLSSVGRLIVYGQFMNTDGTLPEPIDGGEDGTVEIYFNVKGLLEIKAVS